MDRPAEGYYYCLVVGESGCQRFANYRYLFEGMDKDRALDRGKDKDKVAGFVGLQLSYDCESEYALHLLIGMSKELVLVREHIPMAQHLVQSECLEQLNRRELSFLQQLDRGMDKAGHRMAISKSPMLDFDPMDKDTVDFLVELVVELAAEVAGVGKRQLQCPVIRERAGLDSKQLAQAVQVSGDILVFHFQLVEGSLDKDTLVLIVLV